MIDLSHCRKWELDDSSISGFKPSDVTVPEPPGDSRFENGILINRMGKTQASIGASSEQLQGDAGHPAFTETTDGLVLLVLPAPECIFNTTEKLTSLEFGKTPPFLLFGPFSHVPCQIVVLQRTGRMEFSCWPVREHTDAT